MHRGLCHCHQWDSSKKHRPSIIVYSDCTESYGGWFYACWRCHWVKPAVNKVKYRLWSFFVGRFIARKYSEPF